MTIPYKCKRAIVTTTKPLASVQGSDRVRRSALLQVERLCCNKRVCGYLLGSHVTPLLHERADRKPKRIVQGKLVLKYVRVFGVARMWIFPFVRAKPKHKTCTLDHRSYCRRLFIYAVHIRLRNTVELRRLDAL